MKRVIGHIRNKESDYDLFLSQLRGLFIPKKYLKYEKVKPKKYRITIEEVQSEKE